MSTEKKTLPKDVALKAGKLCLGMELNSSDEFVYVVNGICYFQIHRVKQAVQFGGNPRPEAFKVSRDGKTFKVESI